MTSSQARIDTWCDWFGLTGADLLWQLPPGVAVVIDPLDEHCVVIRPRG